METKIYQQNLKIGEIFYKKLHKEIIKERNLLSILKIFESFIKEHRIDGHVWYQDITINEDFCYIITNNKNNNKIYWRNNEHNCQTFNK